MRAGTENRLVSRFLYLSPAGWPRDARPIGPPVVQVERNPQARIAGREPGQQGCQGAHPEGQGRDHPQVAVRGVATVRYPVLRIRQFAQDADHVLQVLLSGRGQAQRAGGALGQPELLLSFTERYQNVTPQVSGLETGTS